MGDNTPTSLEGQLLSYAIDRYTDDGDESETTSSDNSEATESAESETTSSDNSETTSSDNSETTSSDESETTSSDESEASSSDESEASSSDESEASSSDELEDRSPIFKEERDEIMDQLPLWARLALQISNGGFAVFFGWLFLQTSMHLVLFPLALVCGMFVQTIVVYIINSVYLYVSDTDH